MRQVVNFCNSLPMGAKVILPTGRIVLLCVAFFALLMTAYIYQVIDKMGVGHRLSIIEEQKRLVISKAIEITKRPEVKNRSTMEKELQSTNQDIARKERILALLRSKLSVKSDGFSAYFYGLAETNVPELWLTKIEIIGGEQVNLTGKTTQTAHIAELMKKLSGLPVFSEQHFSSFDTRPVRDDPTILDFTLQGKGKEVMNG